MVYCQTLNIFKAVLHILLSSAILFEVLWLCVCKSQYSNNFGIFFCLFVDFCGGQSLHGGYLFTLNNVFICESVKGIFYWPIADSQMDPFPTRGTANQIARKSCNHRGLYWTLILMAQISRFLSQVWDNSHGMSCVSVQMLCETRFYTYSYLVYMYIWVVSAKRLHTGCAKKKIYSSFHKASHKSHHATDTSRCSY